MYTVTTVIPEILRPLIKGNYRYKCRSTTKFGGKQGVSGTPVEKFAQRQLMGNVESTVNAIGMLEGDGLVTVVVHKGTSVVHAELTMPNEKCRSVAANAMNEIRSTADVIAEVHPKAVFELNWQMKTVYLEAYAID